MLKTSASSGTKDTPDTRLKLIGGGFVIHCGRNAHGLELIAL
jgi:hypothetical protein